MRTELPAGVKVLDVTPHVDARGALHEIYRQSSGAPALRQWNLVHCQAGTVRGMHAHIRHTDYLLVLSGRFVFGLQDIRRDSPTFRRGAQLQLDGAKLQALLIPPGVAHGFLCEEIGTQVYGMTHEWTPDDDVECRWDEEELGFRFRIKAPIISERDAAAGSLDAMIEAYARANVRAHP